MAIDDKLEGTLGGTARLASRINCLMPRPKEAIRTKTHAHLYSLGAHLYAYGRVVRLWRLHPFWTCADNTNSLVAHQVHCAHHEYSGQHVCVCSPSARGAVGPAMRKQARYSLDTRRHTCGVCLRGIQHLSEQCMQSIAGAQAGGEAPATHGAQPRRASGA